MQYASLLLLLHGVTLSLEGPPIRTDPDVEAAVETDDAAALVSPDMSLGEAERFIADYKLRHSTWATWSSFGARFALQGLSAGAPAYLYNGPPYRPCYQDLQCLFLERLGIRVVWFGDCLLWDEEWAAIQGHNEVIRAWIVRTHGLTALERVLSDSGCYQDHPNTAVGPPNPPNPSLQRTRYASR